MNIKKKVYNYKTKYKEGFIRSEIKDLLKDFPYIDKKAFNRALIGNTYIVQNNEIITYHCDIEKALYCGIEKRNLYSWEWD